MSLASPDLATIIRSSGMLKDKDLDSALERAKKQKISLEDSLTSSDLLTSKNLSTLLADHYQLPPANLDTAAIDTAWLKTIPLEIARDHHCLCIGHIENAVHIATSNPNQTDFFRFLSQKYHTPLKLFFASDQELNQTYYLYKQNLEKAFKELLGGQNTENSVPITKIVDTLINYAHSSRASDIHIEPETNDSIIRFRIDGVLQEVLTIPKNLHEQIITRIKVLSELRTDEHASAQDGKVRTNIEGEDLDIRVSLVPIVEGEKAVLRLLSANGNEYSLTDLGMTESDHEHVKDAAFRPYGMILSTGPTGSGKTTTIYSLLKILNTKERNIATIEDPVEYELAGINQIQVNNKTNLTFANGLRAILRQDPNIIYVGEIRDNETADIAINSAMTGHLVLSTLHTNDALTTIPRLTELGVEPFLLSSTLNVIIGQRLVRKICDHCKISQSLVATKIKKTLPEYLTKKYLSRKKELNLYKGKGCPSCNNTGYRGRLGVFEVLVISDNLKEGITNKLDIAKLREIALKEGFIPMIEDGFQKVLSGQTTFEELVRVVNN